MVLRKAMLKLKKMSIRKTLSFLKPSVAKISPFLILWVVFCRKILSFLKPSAAKISLFLILWVVFCLAFILVLKDCIFADCRDFRGNLIPCCGLAKTSIAYSLYQVRVLLFGLTYLLSCFLSDNLTNVGSRENEIRRM